MQELDKLMLDLHSGNEVACPKPYCEVDARIGKSMVPHSRLKSENCTFRVRHQFARHVEGDTLDLLKIAVVIDSKVHTYCKFMVGQTKICDDTARQLAIGYYHHSVVQHSHACVAPAHPDDMSLFTALQFHEMTRLDWLFRDHINTGKQVGQCVLKRQ